MAVLAMMPERRSSHDAQSPLHCSQDNDAVKAGLSRYIKKKKLERIDTYVAPLLAARDQLVRVGRVMRECGCHFVPAGGCTWLRSWLLLPCVVEEWLQRTLLYKRVAESHGFARCYPLGWFAWSATS
jgi:hypothetical protein